VLRYIQLKRDPERSCPVPVPREALPAGSLLSVTKSDGAVGRFFQNHTRLLMTPEISINSTASGMDV
jgi:hypothetical protein